LIGRSVFDDSKFVIKRKKSSTMTQEEKKEFFYQIGKVEKKMDEVENKMDENKKEMEKHREKKMLELQKSMSSMILHALDERVPKGDIKVQGNHENIEEIRIESQNHNH
jgi:hypothetical protein